MRAAFRQALMICLLALVPAMASALLHPKRPAWSAEKLGEWELTVSDVGTWKDKPLWIDARPAADFERSHIPGAVPLNEDHWDEQLPRVLGAWKQNQSIIVYCDSAECDSSHAVAGRLREAGLAPVFVLKGGWAAWQAENK
jgi:rhodanese-related sulfurtransferase